MDDRHQRLLRRHNVSFRKFLEPKKIIPYLSSKEVIDDDDVENINNQPTVGDQVDMLLKILPKRGPDAFLYFVEALESVSTQAYLVDFLRQDKEAKEMGFLEAISELRRVRSNSAKVRDKLRETCVEQDNIRKELEELKSLNKALLYQSKNDKEALNLNIRKLSNTNETLAKNLERSNQEKLVLEENNTKLEKELHNKNLAIKRMEIDLQRNDTDIDKLNSRKMSGDDSITREKRQLLRRRTNSAKSERILTKRVIASCAGMEDFTPIDRDMNNNILYGQSKDTSECILQHNAKIKELERKLIHLAADRELALTCCKKLEEELQSYEEKHKSKIDKETTPMEESGITTCSKCIEYESELSEYKELRQQAKKKLECALKDVTDKHEREKKDLESSLQKLEELYNTAKQEFMNEMENVRNEMTVKHAIEMKDSKDELESQTERDKLTIERLKSDLDKIKETIKTIKAANKAKFQTYKKETNAEKKKLKDNIKSKDLRVRQLEDELKEAQEEKNNDHDVISSLREDLRKEQEIKEELRDELAQWRALPGGRIFNFKDDFDRNGIIYNLGTNFSTKPFVNPAKSGNHTIKVKRSSCKHGQPSDILDLAHCKGALSCTADAAGSWWQVDLGETHALYVTHYTLRHGGDNGLSVLKNWNLEGSVDGRRWIILRKHEDDYSLKGNKGTFPFFTATWAIEGKVEAMRYFRILQTGKNSAGRYALYLSGFEIYGVLLKL